MLNFTFDCGTLSRAKHIFSSSYAKLGYLFLGNPKISIENIINDPNNQLRCYPGDQKINSFL